ncbi:MAG: glutathione S-transferase [Myxococcales bacterium]|nr:glutathione S-transferase [Myxococcales bacterium]
MKLYRFRYSSYARKVQMLLDLAGARYELVEVPYSDRDELARVTGGYMYVPVLVDDRGQVITESRDICRHVLGGAAGSRLLPPPWEGPIWSYADFVDGPLEDVLFRIASPAIRDAWPSAGDRALFVLVKERKFGPGCVDAWLRDRAVLVRRAQKLLEPTFRTLEGRRFLFGPSPTLADAALYGVGAMLEEGDPQLLAHAAAARVLSPPGGSRRPGRPVRVTRATSARTTRRRSRVRRPARDRVLPVREQRAQRGDEREWLIQDEMMVRLGDLDERRGSLQELVHVLASLGRYDHAALAAQERDATAGASQVVAHLFRRDPDEDARVELPGEAAVHRP